MTSVTTNVGSLMAANAVKLVQRNADNASLRLSTGKRVNFSADDAAGLAVANKMVSQIRGMKVAAKNTADGISLLQTAIAGMQNSLEIVQRMRELALQSHNGVYVDGDRGNLQKEVDSLLGELNRIATHTKFNDVNLLDGSFSRDMRVGNTNPEIVNVTIDGMGINKNVEGKSYASGSAVQILSPLEFAAGSSNFSLVQNSFATGQTDPDYLSSVLATDIRSSFNLPSESQASVVLSEPAYLAEDFAVGSSQSLLALETEAFGNSSPVVKASSDAEVRDSSVISSVSRFTAKGFQNGDFTDGTATINGDVASIPGWDIYLRQPELDGDSYEIGGFQVPLDNNTPLQSNESQSNDFLNNREITNPNLENLVEEGALYLRQGGYNHTSFAVVRGPYVVSQAPVSLEAGDSVSFKWFGLSGGDAFDVYGYLLNVNDGSSIELLNQTSAQSFSSTQGMGLGDDGWITSSANVTQNGDYKFVFIAGSYDRTGGQYLGNGLAIKDVEVTQANPPPETELQASVTIQAIESNQVRINSSLLVSASESEDADPGGVYSILAEGSDFNKFTIDPLTGDIISSALDFDVQQTYRFKVRYDGPGGISHTETVNLNLTPHDEAFTNLTAIEATSVSIDQNAISTFASFFNFEASRNLEDDITYSLASYTDNDNDATNNGNSNDFQRFSIDQNTGRITSNGPLNFSDQERYQFNAIATASDGRRFVNHVILDIADTGFSEASLEVEETDRIRIDITQLNGSSSYASRHPGGVFSIVNNGADSELFDIVGSEIIGNFDFRIPTQDSYTIDLLYTVGDNQHVETIVINLSEFLQSDTNLIAKESQQIGIDIGDLTYISQFALADNYLGSFRIERYDNEDGNLANDGDADDATQFSFDAVTRQIYSNTPLDYTIEDEFHFNLVYRNSEGVEFTDRIVLNLEDTLQSSAVIAVEESDQMIINISDITASNEYSMLNPGGNFTVVPANSPFQVVGNQLIANGSFRIENQSSFNFDLLYSHDGVQHSEDITVNLTRFMQSTGEFTALEGERVVLNGNNFIHLADFASDNPGGIYSVSGPDSGLFSVTQTGDVFSRTGLDYDIQNTYNISLDYSTGGKTFSSEVILGLEDTLTANSNLECEEAQQVIISGNILQSIKNYAQKDNNQGIFELVEMGDYEQFTISADGTLTSIGELRMSDKPSLDLYVRYKSNTIDNFIEHIRLDLTPTSYDHSRSEYSATESSEVVIVPQLNSFLAAYAAADNYQGTFELAQSPYTTLRDYQKFDIDNTGQITSLNAMDFESGRTEFELTVFYNHSSGTKRYTDYRRLEISNDKRDDNNLALEGLDISTREGAAEAAKLLQEVVVRISSSQAKLGAIENRLTHNLDNLGKNLLLSNQANGRIIDADYAKESTKLARARILQQAATDMLVKSNQAKQNILMLIQ